MQGVRNGRYVNINEDQPPSVNSVPDRSGTMTRHGAASRANVAAAPRRAASRWAAVILAAGQGTRMRSTLPKVAHPIAGRPIVRHVIEAARDAGIDDCVVIVSGDASADAVRAAAGSGVRFAVQPQPLGTGDAVLCARSTIARADYVLIMNGDVPLVLPDTLRRLMSAVERGEGESIGPDLALLTAEVPLEAYGLVELDGDRVTAIVETKENADIDRSQPVHINSGQYAVRAQWLWPHLERVERAANGEFYLTQLAVMASAEGIPAIAIRAGDPDEVRGINDRVQLAEAEAIMRRRILDRHMLAGVTISDPSSTFIDAGVSIEADTVVEPATHIRGATSVGAACIIGPGAHVHTATIGDRCSVRYSMIEESTLEAAVEIGPYSHIRPGSHIAEGVHIGNFAEVKASRLGPHTRMGHFSYIGDADVGADVNIGAGTITANFDGANKHKTTIGDGAFIGSDTMLIAPVRIGARAQTSAGAVVNRDVPDDMRAIGAPARVREKARVDEEERDAER